MTEVLPHIGAQWQCSRYIILDIKNIIIVIAIIIFIYIEIHYYYYRYYYYYIFSTENNILKLGDKQKEKPLE